MHECVHVGQQVCKQGCRRKHGLQHGCAVGKGKGDAAGWWQGRVGKPQRNPLILSAQMPGSRPGSVCVTMIKHQWQLLRREGGRERRVCVCSMG